MRVFFKENWKGMQEHTSTSSQVWLRWDVRFIGLRRERYSLENSFYLNCQQWRFKLCDRESKTGTPYCTVSKEKEESQFLLKIIYFFIVIYLHLLLGTNIGMKQQIFHGLSIFQVCNNLPRFFFDRNYGGLLKERLCSNFPPKILC